MQDHLMALLDQQLAGHQAETCRRAGNKNPRHGSEAFADRGAAVKRQTFIRASLFVVAHDLLVDGA
jgi:hypothetical protein